MGKTVKQACKNGPEQESFTQNGGDQGIFLGKGVKITTGKSILRVTNARMANAVKIQSPTLLETMALAQNQYLPTIIKHDVDKV